MAYLIENRAPMFELLVAAIDLGIAGIDPVGALVAVTSLAAGARDRTSSPPSR